MYNFVQTDGQTEAGKGKERRPRRFLRPRNAVSNARAGLERCLIYAFRVSFVPRMNSTANKNHRFDDVYASTIPPRSPHPLFLGIVIGATQENATRGSGGENRLRRKRRKKRKKCRKRSGNLLSLSLPLFFVRFVSTEMLGKRKCGSGDNAVLRHL